MDTITQSKDITVSGDEMNGYFLFDAEGERAVSRGQYIQGFAEKSDAESMRRVLLMGEGKSDPEPWITIATGERSSLQPEALAKNKPRLSWPEHGGRMVRRDYLRPGDRAVSSHYGVRTVAAVLYSGDESQVTQITWVSPDGISRPLSERHDSHTKIEILSD